MLVATGFLVLAPPASAHCESPLDLTQPECVKDWTTNVEGWKRFVCNVTTLYGLCLYLDGVDVLP